MNLEYTCEHFILSFHNPDALSKTWKLTSRWFTQYVGAPMSYYFSPHQIYRPSQKHNRNIRRKWGHHNLIESRREISTEEDTRLIDLRVKRDVLG